MTPFPKTLRSLRPLLLALAPLPFTLGCASMCGGADAVSNQSTGSFAYQPASASKATSGALATSVLEISATQSGAVSIAGYFTDASGLSHSFTVALLGITSQTDAPVGIGSTIFFADCSPGDADGSCIYANESTVPLTGTLVTGSFSTDCHGSQGCALSITATLHASATVANASFDLNLDLSSQSTWQTYACASSNDDSS